MRLWQREVMDGVPVLRVPRNPSHDASAVGRVANYASFALTAATFGAALVGGADVAYVYHPPATVGLPAMVLKALRGMPFVYHIADMWPESVVDSGMLQRAYSTTLRRRDDRSVVSSSLSERPRHLGAFAGVQAVAHRTRRTRREGPRDL